MKKIFISKSAVFFALGLSFLLFSCNEKKKDFDFNEDTLQLEITASEEKIGSEKQEWHITNKKICVLFGYDFNAPETVEFYKDLLEKKFGLDSEDGLISTITYPDDFKHNGRTYVSELKAFLSDGTRDFCGVVILGAPENTHIALARLQDEWNMEIPFPIIALFPQDDILGLEATCDIVIDRMQSGELAEEEFTNDQLFISEKAPSILCKTIDYINILAAPLPRDTSIQQNVVQMYNGEKIAHYLDPETGLQSINHFILY